MTHLKDEILSVKNRYRFMSEQSKFKKMLENPTKYQQKAIYDAKEKACKDAMKSSKSKNPHNKGSNLAELWDFIYEEYYQIQ